jgi:signal transduction histidine kinase
VLRQDAQRIFERFVKGSDRSGGSGLGLSIVAAIAKAHGGYAHLGPGSGPGARFEIVLPRHGAEPAGARDLPSSPAE